MNTHLSSFRLDEAVTGLPLPENERQHLESCVECHKKVTVLQKELQELASDFQSVRISRHLQDIAEPKPSKRLFSFGFVAAFAVAALAIWVVPSVLPQQDARLKGSDVSFEVLRAKDGTSVSSTHAGDLLALEVSTPKPGFSSLVMVDVEGTVSVLWPVDGDDKGAIAAGATMLNSGFRVTPGSFTLHVFVTDTPWHRQDILDSFSHLIQIGREQGQSPLDVRWKDASVSSAAKTIQVESLP